jgi:hypothetical protein
VDYLFHENLPPEGDPVVPVEAGTTPSDRPPEDVKSDLY